VVCFEDCHRLCPRGTYIPLTEKEKKPKAKDAKEATEGTSQGEVPPKAKSDECVAEAPSVPPSTMEDDGAKTEEAEQDPFAGVSRQEHRETQRVLRQIEAAKKRAKQSEKRKQKGILEAPKNEDGDAACKPQGCKQEEPEEESPKVAEASTETEQRKGECGEQRNAATESRIPADTTVADLQCAKLLHEGVSKGPTTDTDVAAVKAEQGEQAEQAATVEAMKEKNAAQDVARETLPAESAPSVRASRWDRSARPSPEKPICRAQKNNWRLHAGYGPVSIRISNVSLGYTEKKLLGLLARFGPLTSFNKAPQQDSKPTSQSFEVKYPTHHATEAAARFLAGCQLMNSTLHIEIKHVMR